MTREETTSILSIIKAAYPRSYAHMKSKDAEAVLNLWEMQFKDDDFALVFAAVNAYISSSTTGFEPSPGHIKEKMRLISSPKRMSAAEAWTLLDKAAQNSQYKFQEEFRKLPDILKKFVGSPTRLRDFSFMDEKQFDTVIYSQFVRFYNEQTAQDEALAALPEPVKQYRDKLLSQSPGNDARQLNG